MAYPRSALMVPLVFLVSTVTAQAATSTATGYPSATSSPTLVQQAFNYNPSIPAAGIFAGLYGIVTIVLFCRLFVNRTWWGLCLPIGAAFMTAGFVLRIEMIKNPNSNPILLSSLLSILLSPAAFLAFNYILYGRFVLNCVPRDYSLIRPERAARYFIFSDIATFLVQGTGGSFTTSSNHNTVLVGVYIVIAGLALQTLSYGLFMLLLYYVYRSVKRSGIQPFKEPWGKILKMLFFTSIFFLIRCIYRTIELAQGLGSGYLADHEAFFYVFDSLPLLIGISTYAVDWPGRYLFSDKTTTTTANMMSQLDV